MTDKAYEFLNRGIEALTKNQLQDAEKDFLSALEISPTLSEARVELARLHIALGHMADAEKVIAEVFKETPENSRAFALKGILLNAKKQFVEAREFLKKSIEKDPASDLAYVNLGIAERELGNFSDSEQSIRKAIEINPKNYEARYCLGYVLLLQNRIEEGIQQTSESVELNLFFTQGYLALGSVYELIKRSDLTEACYKRALAYTPDARVVRQRLIQLYLKFKRFDSAIGHMRVLAGQRESATDWIHLGRLCMAIRKLDWAEAAFKNAEVLARTSWEPHYNLGDIYMTRNLTELAGKAYELSIRYNNGSFKPHNGMGVWFLKQRQYNDAIQEFKRACEMAPSSPIPAYNLGLAFANAGKTKEARASLAKVLAMPKGARVRKDARQLMRRLPQETRS